MMAALTHLFELNISSDGYSSSLTTGVSFTTSTEQSSCLVMAAAVLSTIKPVIPGPKNDN